MAGHAQLKFVMTECSKTQIRLTGLIWYCIVSVINDWAKILDNGGQVDTFILDFEKAFDTPSHELLKSKLFSYGINGRH